MCVPIERIKWNYVFGMIAVGVLLSVFPVTQIAIGAVYLHECPAAPGIPVYVMVCGISSLLLMALYALPKFLRSAALDKVLTVCMITMGLFILIWFFYGSYQIYSVYPPNYEKNITDPDKNNSNFFTSAEPDNKLAPALDNHNQSLLNLNQNQSIQNLNQNQSLLNPNQTEAIKNSQTWKRLIQTSAPVSSEHLKAPQRVSSAVTYCNKTLYLLSFWSTTLIYSVAGNALLIAVCLYGCMALVKIISL